ncbi:hypothetical protein [Actinoplanes sp. NPDC051851]|uniref:hypothetical protein n=1 Tax=Actinoplanes sp. NPDC051851 TaxID=3154753 RepID=UPI0034201791
MALLLVLTLVTAGCGHRDDRDDRVVAGTSLAEVALPPVAGTMTVTLAGGASQLTVHVTGDAPVRVRVGGGAGTATIDGVRHTGITGGTDFTPPGWATATGRYDIDLTSGVSNLTVDRR